MPQGKGTYGSKRGRPPKKQRKVVYSKGYSAGGGGFYRDLSEISDLFRENKRQGARKTSITLVRKK